MKCKKCGSEMVVSGYLGSWMMTMYSCSNCSQVNDKKVTKNE